MSTIAITGASGFIGRRLVNEAARRGWSVRALVRNRPPSAVAKNVVFVRWDALDATEPDMLAGVDVVCHLAAFIPPDFNDPGAAEACFRVNALGAVKLLEAASQAGLRRMVFFSSGNAYAPGPPLLKEDCPQRPARRAPYYLMSKVCGEVFVEHWAWSRGLSACSLRVGSVYGPGMDERGLLPTLARRLLAGEPVILRDGGLHTADFVHVDDVAAAALAAAEGDATGPLNIGSGEATAAAALADMLAALTGASPDLVHVEKPRPGTGATGFGALDIGRARELLAYRPRSLRLGLREYVEWLAGEGAGERPLRSTAPRRGVGQD